MIEVTAITMVLLMTLLLNVVSKPHPYLNGQRLENERRVRFEKKADERYIKEELKRMGFVKRIGRMEPKGAIFVPKKIYYPTQDSMRYKGFAISGSFTVNSSRKYNPLSVVKQHISTKRRLKEAEKRIDAARAKAEEVNMRTELGEGIIDLPKSNFIDKYGREDLLYINELGMGADFPDYRQEATYTVAASNSKHPEGANYKCTGVDDDATIQLAIDALPAGGGKIILLDGLFTFNIRVDVVSNLTLEGQGTSTILKMANKVTSNLNSDANVGQPNVVVNDTTGYRVGMDVTIWDDDHTGYEGGEVNRIASISAGAPGTLTMTTNLENTYTTVLNALTFSSYNMLDLENCDHVSIRNLQIDGNLANNTLGDFDEYQNGVFLKISDNCEVKNCYIHDLPYCPILSTHTGADGCDHLVITGNRFFNAGVRSQNIHLHCGYRALIANNVFLGTGVFGYLCDNMIINSNEFYNTTENVIYLLDCDKSIVSHNQLEEGAIGTIAIYFFGTTNSVIEANIIDSTNLLWYGIRERSTSDYNIIKNNIILAACNFRLTTDGVHTIVKDNKGYVHIQEIRDMIANILNSAGGDVRGLWPLQEITGTTIQDYSRNNHDLTPSEDVDDWDSRPSAGTKGRSTYYTFDGVDEELDTPDHADFEFGNAAGNDDSAFSVICIISPHADVVASGGTLIGKYDEDTPAREWVFRIDSNGYPEFECYDESADKYIGREYQTALTAATWTILIATYSGNEASGGCKIYKDGAQVDDATHEDLAYVGMERLGAAVTVGANIVAGPVAGNFYKGDGTWFMVVGGEISANNVWIIDQRLRGLLGI